MTSPAASQVPLEIPTQNVLGASVALLNMGETLAAVEKLVDSGGQHLIATVDSSGLVIAQDDPELAEIYKGASLCTADSYGVVWALRRQGADTPRVSGVDLADGICALAAKRGWSIYLLGAGPGVAEEAAEKLQTTHSGLKIAGVQDGYFSAEEEPDVIEAVRAAAPDIVFVAMGIPRQEKLLNAHMKTMGAKVGVGLGGSLDVFSGRVKRAPLIIQKLRIEWLWRLILNPSKIAKVMMLPKFMMHVIRDGR